MARIHKKAAVEVIVRHVMQNPPATIAERLVIADAIAALECSLSEAAKRVAEAIRNAEKEQLTFFGDSWAELGRASK